jgi:hypothetical protein
MDDCVATGSIQLVIRFMTGTTVRVRVQPEITSLHWLLLYIERRECISPDALVLIHGGKRIWRGNDAAYQPFVDATFGDLDIWQDTDLYAILNLRGD